jgi:hypothetical protein
MEIDAKVREGSSVDEPPLFLKRKHKIYDSHKVLIVEYGGIFSFMKPYS